RHEPENREQCGYLCSPSHWIPPSVDRQGSTGIARCKAVAADPRAISTRASHHISSRLRDLHRQSESAGLDALRGNAQGARSNPPGRACYTDPARMTTLPLGKLRPAFLGELLAQQKGADPRVVVGPRVGEDAAVLDMGDRYLVATTDPITFVTDDLGWYALVVNANDLAVRGAAPRWFLATCLLPEGRTTEADVAALFAQVGAGCRSLDVTLIGGHTEVTPGLDRAIV